jgi:hypothetical protein
MADTRGAQPGRMQDQAFCKDEADASLRCLDQNQYDRSQCQAFFSAYKECKKRWVCVCVSERACVRACVCVSQYA